MTSILDIKVIRRCFNLCEGGAKRSSYLLHASVVANSQPLARVKRDGLPQYDWLQENCSRKHSPRWSSGGGPTTNKEFFSQHRKLMLCLNSEINAK